MNLIIKSWTYDIIKFRSKVEIEIFLFNKYHLLSITFFKRWHICFLLLVPLEFPLMCLVSLRKLYQDTWNFLLLRSNLFSLICIIHFLLRSHFSSFHAMYFSLTRLFVVPFGRSPLPVPFIFLVPLYFTQQNSCHR